MDWLESPYILVVCWRYYYSDYPRVLGAKKVNACVSLTRDELRYILAPKEVYGDDFPSETFRALKEKEIKQFGEYRTSRLVLEAWDRLGQG